MNSALPLCRSVPTAFLGGAQRVYSQGGARTPASTQRPRSASQGSMISAAVNPTFSQRGSPESPQFLTSTEADFSPFPWPRPQVVNFNPLYDDIEGSSSDDDLPYVGHAYVELNTDHVFQPSPLSKNWRISLGQTPTIPQPTFPPPPLLPIFPSSPPSTLPR